MIRGSPDPFPIFEGGVRLRQTNSEHEGEGEVRAKVKGSYQDDHIYSVLLAFGS